MSPEVHASPAGTARLHLRARAIRGTLAHLAEPVPFGLGGKALCGVYVSMPAEPGAPTCPTCRRLQQAAKASEARP